MQNSRRYPIPLRLLKLLAAAGALVFASARG